MPRNELQLLVDNPSILRRPFWILGAVSLVCTGLAAAALVHVAALLLCLAGLVFGIWLAVDTAAVEYVVTDRRVLRQGGFPARRGGEVPLEFVREVRLLRTPLQTALGIGDVEVVSTKGTLRLEGLEAPERLQEKIRSLI
ncbi:MAG: hypothetical protein A2X36_14490 [Elusimicrobia bacterium GWA2_69_24]|nr:MAG: hypothetical protein A2X36_14490 [Elusimicrobia bacterium GWA2_69_24]HBL18398.1 hypothetical protein [Elusimicrobiota bacterium]